MVQEVHSNGILFWTGKDGDGYGGFFCSEESQNPRSDSSKDNGSASGIQSFEVSAPKRIRLSPGSNQQEGDVDCSEERSLLGLTLRKTPSLVNLIQMKLSQESTERKTNPSNDTIQASKHPKINDYLSQPMSEKLKASNFPASFIRIGSWERISMHEGNLIAKCYYAKRKLVWEVLEGALKSKIEIQWSDILAIRASLQDGEPGILEIELNQPPLFFRETNPQPRKHTLWQQASDFTGGQAPNYRRHYVSFPPGTLDRHYEKLLQCDNRLLMLSQRPFPSLESPYFLSNVYGFPEFSFDFNGWKTEFPSRFRYPVQTFPSSFVPSPHVQNFKPMTRLPFGIMNSDSPMSVMDFPRVDKKASNYAFEDQRANNIVTVSTIQPNPAFPCQNYQVPIAEEIGTLDPNTRLLNEVENHWLGDSQVNCSDEKKLLARMRSMCSLLEPHGGINSLTNSSMNHLKYGYQRVANDHLVPNSTTEHQGVNGELMYPMHQNNNNLSYQYVPSEQVLDDFATLNSSQEVHH